MTPDERLKFMKKWLEDLNDEYPNEHKQEIECLSWAIKECQKNSNRKKAYKIKKEQLERYDNI